MTLIPSLQGPLYLSLLHRSLYTKGFTLGSILFCHHLKILNIHKDLVFVILHSPYKLCSHSLIPAELLVFAWASLCSCCLWYFLVSSKLGGSRTWLLTLQVRSTLISPCSVSWLLLVFSHLTNLWRPEDTVSQGSDL